MNRRRVLAALGGALATSLAGCSGETGGGATSPTDTKRATRTATATRSPTATAAQVTYNGPVDEDRQAVDLRYRPFTADEAAAVKTEAASPGYRPMFRNIEDWRGEIVTFDATVAQVIDGEAYDALLLFVDGDPGMELYGSWVGDRVLEQDSVRVWGQVLGTETYQTALGASNTVPALALADVELLSGEPSTTPTATATDTPTETATGSPTPQAPRVTATGQWALVETGDLRFGAKVATSRTTDALGEGDLAPDHEDEAPLEAPDGEQWVIANTEFRQRGGSTVTLDPTQWTMTDLQDIQHAPDSEAMRKGADTLPSRERLAPGDVGEYRVIFATPYPSDPAFEMTPYGGDSYRAIRWE